MNEIEFLTLVRLAQFGDREAFSQIVIELESTVFAIVLRRLKNRDEALEVTQEVFIQVLRKISQLREPERFLGWLRRIAVRMAINRAVRRPREVLGGDESVYAVGSTSSNPLDQILRSENAAQIRQGMARLRTLDRQTLVAFYFEGRSIEQMSNEFDSPVGTIKRRLHTARNRLRDQLVELQVAG
jgi:RNA polymerase sigma-70 factor (ECF subfamily)